MLHEERATASPDPLRTLLSTFIEALIPDEAFVFPPSPAGDRPWHPDHFTHGYRELADQIGITEPLTRDPAPASAIRPDRAHRASQHKRSSSEARRAARIAD
jgi:hypothetical protein